MGNNRRGISIKIIKMVKFKTKTDFPLWDKRNKSLGSHLIRLIVNEINANASGVRASGFYYYEFEGNEIVLDAFKTDILWQSVELAETQLADFNANSLRSAFIQRIIEFSFLQQQIESGENYGTVYEDWELDQENEELLKSEKSKK